MILDILDLQNMYYCLTLMNRMSVDLYERIRLCLILNEYIQINLNFLQTQHIACLVNDEQFPVGTPPASRHSPIKTHVPIN